MLYDTVILILRALCGFMLLVNAYLFSLTLLGPGRNRALRRRNIRFLRSFSSNRFSIITKALLPAYAAITTYPFQASFFGRRYVSKTIDRFSHLSKHLPEKGGKAKLITGSVFSALSSIFAIPLLSISSSFLIIVIVPAVVAVTNLRYLHTPNRKSPYYKVHSFMSVMEQAAIYNIPLHIYILCFAPINMLNNEPERLVLLLFSNFYFLTFATNYFIYSILIIFLSIRKSTRKFNRLYIYTHGPVSGFSFGAAASPLLSALAIIIGHDLLFESRELADPNFIILNLLFDGAAFGAAGFLANLQTKSQNNLNVIITPSILLLSSFVGSFICSIYLFYRFFGFDTVSLSFSLVFGADALLLDEGFGYSIRLTKEFLAVHTSFIPSAILLSLGIFSVLMVTINALSILIISISTKSRNRIRDIVALSGMIWFGFGSLLSLLSSN